MTRGASGLRRIGSIQAKRERGQELLESHEVGGAPEKIRKDLALDAAH